MTQATDHPPTHRLSLVDELLLTLLDEESGYFHQVPGWDLHCALAGAALGELSLLSRIDTDTESLILLDETPTGDPILDPILEKITAEAEQRDARYWIERLAVRADSIIDLTLEHLAHMKIIEHHDGDFWTLSRTGWQAELHAGSREGTGAEFVKTRISRVIFDNEIPSPRDVIIVCLVNTCDVLRTIFPLDEKAEERVAVICKMDLIGRAIGDAVSESSTGPLLRRASLAKSIPVVPLRRLLLRPHVRSGNIPALVAELAEEYGPVFEIRPPFGDHLIVLAGPRINHWMHRQGRMYLRARDHLEDFEKVYDGVGILPTLDGADHFRYRKTIQPAYARARLEARLDEFYAAVRKHMATWTVGDSLSAVSMCRRLVNSQMSPLTVGVDSQDVVDDLHKFKERALKTHIARTLPKFMLGTPGMKRRARLVDEVVERVQSGHTPAQRAGCPRDLADDLLNMHSANPQFLPESNLKFVLSAPLIASMYVGDQLGFIVHAMVSQPAFYEKIRGIADTVFTDGDPDSKDVLAPETEFVRHFIMECMRLYPIVPMTLRTVMNTCVVEGYELPEGRRVAIAQAATHYMGELFADPFTFDVDRYLPPRSEHVGTAYAPYGLGTHNCLGARWTELQLMVNLLMLVHYFGLEIAPANYRLKIKPFPSMRVDNKLRFVLAEQRHELPG